MAKKTINFSFDKTIAKKKAKKAVSSKFAIMKDSGDMFTCGAPGMSVKVSFSDSETEVSGGGFAGPIVEQVATMIEQEFEEYMETQANNANSSGNDSGSKPSFQSSSTQEKKEVVELLKQYKDLLECGVISEEEFNALKSKCMSTLNGTPDVKQGEKPVEQSCENVPTKEDHDNSAVLQDRVTEDTNDNLNTTKEVASEDTKGLGDSAVDSSVETVPNDSQKMENAPKKKLNKRALSLSVIIGSVILVGTVMTAGILISKYSAKDINATPVAVGDRISFGHYEQDNDTSNGAEPIFWRVLAKNGNKLTLISECGLDAKEYNNTNATVTWETCTLRSWMNGDFYSNAFSSDEKSRIKTTHRENPNNPSFGTEGGNATDDNVWLPTYDEAKAWFSSDADRRCMPTAYARANGAYESSNGCCKWWLSTSGYGSYYACYADYDGSVRGGGDLVVNGDYCVRPALTIAI